MWQGRLGPPSALSGRLGSNMRRRCWPASPFLSLLSHPIRRAWEQQEAEGVLGDHGNGHRCCRHDVEEGEREQRGKIRGGCERGEGQRKGQDQAGDAAGRLLVWKRYPAEGDSSSYTTIPESVVQGPVAYRR